LVAVLASGCTGGTTRTASTAHVTQAQVELMGLPKSAFGRAAAALRTGDLSGLLTNAQSAAHTLDPRMTSASLTEGGRLYGYVRDYSLTQTRGAATLTRGAGLLKIDTEVDVFRRDAAATALLTRSLTDLRTLLGKKLNGGGRLERESTFPMPRVADASAGFAFQVGIEGFHLYFTEVVFRYGRLLARVSEARADARNIKTALISSADMLEQRIKAVLAGQTGSASALSDDRNFSQRLRRARVTKEGGTPAHKPA
jgi:hypothetical protein